jgi:hypothetical protein
MRHSLPAAACTRRSPAATPPHSLRRTASAAPPPPHSLRRTAPAAQPPPHSLRRAASAAQPPPHSFGVKERSACGHSALPPHSLLSSRTPWTAAGSPAQRVSATLLNADGRHRSSSSFRSPSAAPAPQTPYHHRRCIIESQTPASPAQSLRRSLGHGPPPGPPYCLCQRHGVSAAPGLRRAVSVTHRPRRTASIVLSPRRHGGATAAAMSPAHSVRRSLRRPSLVVGGRRWAGGG